MSRARGATLRDTMICRAMLVGALLLGSLASCDKKEEPRKPAERRDEKKAPDERADTRSDDERIGIARPDGLGLAGDDEASLLARPLEPLPTGRPGDRASDGTVVSKYTSWRHVLGETETPDAVLEDYLERIRQAAAEHRPDWQPIIDTGRRSVELTFEVPIEQGNPRDRRLYEASIRLFASTSMGGTIAVITPKTMVTVTEIRSGWPGDTDDLEARELTRELQKVLDGVE